MATSNRSHIIYNRRHTTDIRLQLKEKAGCKPEVLVLSVAFFGFVIISLKGGLTVHSVINDAVKTDFNNLTFVVAVDYINTISILYMCVCVCVCVCLAFFYFYSAVINV